MNNKLFPAKGGFAFLLVVLFLGLTLIEAGCANNNVENEAYKKEMTSGPVTRNWIAMDIKFKPDATAEDRDATIRTIEKLIADSLEGRQFQKFSPSILIKKSVFDELHTYSLSIQYTGFANDTIVKPPCACARDCGVCLQVQGFIHNPNDTSNTNATYKNIADISFLTSDTVAHPVMQE